MRTSDDEPVDDLSSGEVVLRAVAQLVHRLQATGHTITIEDAGAAVTVAPPVHEHTWFLLDSCWQDVEAVLNAPETGWWSRHPAAESSTIH